MNVRVAFLISTLGWIAAATGCGGPARDTASPEAVRRDPARPDLAGNDSNQTNAANASVDGRRSDPRLVDPRSIDTVVLITIDTLRADRVGAYGWRAARTPAIDALAARGVRFDRAYATAPITLTSHASLLTGLYPPRHGARHNGLRLRADVPTIAERLRAGGYATGAFVAAFPLDRRFGLDRGFDVYSDTLPRGPDGRALNERPGREVVDEALAWIGRSKPGGRVFAWIHLFEPHAPYEADAGAASKPVGDRTVGDRPVSDRPISERPVSERPVSDRYDDEIARADAQVARVVQALAPRAASTLFVVAADHGEAFGEHGEIGHSIFVYDTTLRVPLIIAGPGMSAAGASSGGAIAGSGDGTGAGAGRSAGGDSGIGRVAPEPVSLVDVVPTLVDLLGLAPIETDGVSLRPALAGQTVGRRALYAESLAPLLDFGWSPLRSMREGSDKYIAAPKPELYDVAGDPGETRNRLGQTTATAGAAAASTAIVKTLADRIERINAAAAPVAASAATAPAAAVSSAPQGDGSRRSQTPAGALPTTPSPAAGSQADREALARLQSLGYVGSSTGVGVRDAAGDAARPDPKDRIAIAARIADVTSGELQGAALRAALERLVRDDPRNGQMQMRLGFVLLDAGDCRAAIPRFQAAIAAAVPSADPYLGLAECLGPSGNHTAARNALATADRIEPNNPVVAANLGLLALDEGRTQDAIDRLRAALTRAPDLHQARFALARAYGRAGQRADAAREARELLTRLPANAPQRSEVERLLAAVQ